MNVRETSAAEFIAWNNATTRYTFEYHKRPAFTVAYTIGRYAN